jgi:hypothetical protein
MIRVTEEELAELEEAAKEEYRTVPAFVLVLVRKYLDERRQAKEQRSSQGKSKRNKKDENE